MRAPRRRRPLRRTVAPPPIGVDLNGIAERATYVGSSEHKSHPSFAGPPRLRSDASQCDPQLAERDKLTEWLREAIQRGQIGALWEGEFPRYVWVLRDGTWYEGRLMNRELGEYKGYPLATEERPRGL